MNSANTEEISITVTQEHIDQGKRYSCSDCPIALALLEQYDNDSCEVRVGNHLIWKSKDKVLAAALPVNALNFIDDFDGMQPVTPFTFTIYISES